MLASACFLCNLHQVAGHNLSEVYAYLYIINPCLDKNYIPLLAY